MLQPLPDELCEWKYEEGDKQEQIVAKKDKQIDTRKLRSSCDDGFLARRSCTMQVCAIENQSNVEKLQLNREE